MEKKKPPPGDKAPRRAQHQDRKETWLRPAWQKDPRVEPLERR